MSKEQYLSTNRTSEQSKLEESLIKERISLKNDKRKRDKKKEENRHGGNKSTLYLFPVGETGMRGSLSLLIVSSMPRYFKKKKKKPRETILNLRFGACTCVCVRVCTCVRERVYCC